MYSVTCKKNNGPCMTMTIKEFTLKLLYDIFFDIPKEIVLLMHSYCELFTFTVHGNDFRVIEYADKIELLTKKNMILFSDISIDYFQQFIIKPLDKTNDLLNTDISTIYFDAIIKFDAQCFIKICKQHNHISEYMNITCTLNNVSFSCSGDCCKISSTCDFDDENTIVIAKHVNKNFTYNYIYKLEPLPKVLHYQISFFKYVYIYLGKDYPIFIKFSN
jgi:hypothetical protein